MANNIEGGRKKKEGGRILSEEAAHRSPACRLHTELCGLRIYQQISFSSPLPHTHTHSPRLHRMKETSGRLKATVLFLEHIRRQLEREF